MHNLNWIDWTVCLAYLGIVCTLALASLRDQKDNEDYFVGRRRMNWMAVGVSVFATSFSSISFLGLPERGAYQDFSFYLTILLILLVITPLIVAEGMSERRPIPPTGNTNTHGRFGKDVRQFLCDWVREGPTHHFALGVGHHADTLSRVADCLGMACTIVRRAGVTSASSLSYMS